MKKEKWYVSPWAVTIGGAIFGLMLTITYDFLKEKPILSTISNMGRWLGSIIIAFLNFEIKVWWLLLGIAVSILLLYIAARLLNRDAVEPEYTKYIEDTLKKWKWSWKWSYDKISNKWTIHSLSAHCPKCDTRMTPYHNMIRYDCPRCDYTAGAYSNNDYAEQEFQIEQIIIDNIRRNEFQVK